MPNFVDFSGRPFHFIGIGGIGMSALAYVIAKRQLPVYGSDLRSSHITQRLQEIGARIFWQQDPSNLKAFGSDIGHSSENFVSLGDKGNFREARIGKESPKASPNQRNSTAVLPQVICSTAINPTNPEYRAAVDLGCPVFHRSDVLAALIKDYQSIAVAGTHGKTTTSSMIGYMLLQAGKDPTIVVGGEVNAFQGNARLGHGPYLVAEADESDGTLAKLSAYIGVVTNIELDHPDHYENLEQVVDIFKVFKERCTKLVGCIDSPAVQDKLKPDISYSLKPGSGAQYTVDRVAYRSDGTTARVWDRGEILGQLSVSLLGEHNLSNALAAVAVGRELGLDFETIASNIATFEGTRRRFEIAGEFNDIMFVDDYAHHPSEIRATLSSARIYAGGKGTSLARRVVAIFQPHRYSRTQAFFCEFAESFEEADVAVVTDIYSAGEKNVANISGQLLADKIAENHHPEVHYQSSLESLSEFLKKKLVPGDLALFLGAGNVNKIVPDVMAFHKQASPSSTTRHQA